jgi:hypothetical protein
MPQLIVIFPPILVIAFLASAKWPVKKLTKMEFALELHGSGISFLAPLPILRPDLVEQLTLLILVSCLSLCTTVVCYITVQCRLRQNIALCEKSGLLVSSIVFSTGLLASMILS